MDISVNETMISQNVSATNGVTLILFYLSQDVRIQCFRRYYAVFGPWIQFSAAPECAGMPTHNLVSNKVGLNLFYRFISTLCDIVTDDIAVDTQDKMILLAIESYTCSKLGI